jgi:hypothetical protein
MTIKTLSPGPRYEVPVVHLRSGSPVSLHPDDNGCPGRFIHLAINVLAEHDLILPKRPCLATIVSAALAAQYLFYTAALYGPTPAELDVFVEDFVLRCVSRSNIHVSAVHQSPSQQNVVSA